MFCSKCGNNIENGTQFCSKCGEPVLNNQANNVTNVAVEGVSLNNATSGEVNVGAVASSNQTAMNAVQRSELSSSMASVSTPTPEAVQQPSDLNGSVSASLENVNTNLNNTTSQGDLSVGGTSSVGVPEVQQNANDMSSASNVENMSTQAPASAPVQETVQAQQPVQAPVQTPASAQATVQTQAPVQSQTQVPMQQQMNANVPQMQKPQVNVNAQPKKNNTSFFVAAGGIGAVMVLLICLIASGGVKLNFTVSKGGEKTNSDNQTVTPEKNDDNKTTSTTTTTMKSTTARTTASTVSNEGQYLEFSDLSIYLPEGFEYQYDKDERIFEIISNSKKQLLTFQVFNDNFDDSVKIIDTTYRDELINGGVEIVSEGSNVHKGLKYAYYRVVVSNINGELIIMEFPNVGTVLAQVYTDYATESAYLDTLHEIITKSKTNGNSSTFAPGSDSTFAKEYKMQKLPTKTFE